MINNQYLYKFAKLAQTTNAVENAKNVAGGKDAADMKLPIPQQVDTSKPVQVGLKKTLPTPTFKGILNPLPSTSSTLTKSANTLPSYEDAQRFWQDKNTRGIRDEFQSLLQSTQASNKIGNMFRDLSDSLYTKSNRWAPQNWVRNAFAAAASLPINTLGAAWNLGTQGVNKLFRTPKLQRMLEAHPELAYADTSYSGPTAAIRNIKDGGLSNQKLFDTVSKADDQLMESAISLPINLAVMGGIGTAFKKPISNFAKNTVTAWKNKPISTAIGQGLSMYDYAPGATPALKSGLKPRSIY